jgi:Reverse transcriptase (RNA-dependent DNA polymerase)
MPSPADDGGATAKAEDSESSRALTLREKLEVSWKRVCRDAATDFAPWQFEIRAFDFCADRELGRLASEWESLDAEYSCRPLREVRVPKTNYTTRPGSVPALEDRLRFQVLADDIAEIVEPQLSNPDDGVLCSYRYRGRRESSRMFSGGHSFRGRTLSIAAESPFLVMTDVASFYEHIDLHKLENLLRSYDVPNGLVVPLLGLLKGWTTGTSRQIPQGVWPSDYLGSVYLDPLDRHLRRRGLVHTRFVDDIRIAVSSELEGRRVLVHLEAVLGEMGVGLNDAKTRIVPGSVVRDALFPERSRLVQIVTEAQADSLWLDAYGGEVHDDSPSFELADSQELGATEYGLVLCEELRSGAVSAPIVARCLQELTRLRDFKYWDDLLEGLSVLARSTADVTRYLVAAVSLDPDISEPIALRLSDFLSEGEAAYDWQVAWLLACLHGLPIRQAGVAEAALPWLDGSRRTSEVVRANAALTVGRHGDYSELSGVRRLLDEETSEWVRGAMLAALTHMPETERNQVLKYKKRDGPTCRVVSDAVKAGVDLFGI